MRVTGKHSRDLDTAAMGPLSAWANYLIKEKKDVEREGRDGEGCVLDDEFEGMILSVAA